MRASTKKHNTVHAHLMQEPHAMTSMTVMSGFRYLYVPYSTV